MGLYGWVLYLFDLARVYCGGKLLSVGLPNASLLFPSVSPPDHIRLLTILLYGLYHLIRSNDESEMVVFSIVFDMR
jgi:hypothetical protein